MSKTGLQVETWNEERLVKWSSATAREFDFFWGKGTAIVKAISILMRLSKERRDASKQNKARKSFLLNGSCVWFDLLVISTRKTCRVISSKILRLAARNAKLNVYRSPMIHQRLVCRMEMTSTYCLALLRRVQCPLHEPKSNVFRCAAEKKKTNSMPKCNLHCFAC